MNTAKRRILVVLVDRANYGRMQPVMAAIRAHPALELLVMCAGSMVLERFGSTVDEVERAGFAVHSRVFMELEGSVPVSMAKSVGFGIIEFAGEFGRLQPDIVLLIGDRYEALAAAIAAGYMNLPIAHLQGGEVSGSIDECARHAISKFAHWHFPATARAADYLRRMGESPDCIFNFGCPVGDYILTLDDRLAPGVLAAGSGAELDPARPFNLVIFHPVTTEFGAEQAQVRALLDALLALASPTLLLWPNIDAGADHISKEFRLFRDRHAPPWLRFMKNLAPVDFQKALKRCRVAIGNSSSFVRDTTFSGTPVVLVGDRQHGREIGRNTLCVPPDAARIREAVERQMAHGRYEPDLLYGDGRAAPRIAEALAGVTPYAQKHLDYINRKD